MVRFRQAAANIDTGDVFTLQGFAGCGRPLSRSVLQSGGFKSAKCFRHHTGHILRSRTWSQMLRDALNQTTSNIVVKEVMAAFGLMLFGSLIVVGTAPSPSVACARVWVIAVISSESAMVEGCVVNVVVDDEGQVGDRVVYGRLCLCFGDCLYTTVWQANGRCDPRLSRHLPLRTTHSAPHC